MRISDWSSDVCSSDLSRGPKAEAPASERVPARKPEWVQEPEWALVLENLRLRRRSGRSDWQGLRRSPVRSCRNASLTRDRKGVVSGKSVSVRVDIGGRRIIKQKNESRQTTIQI